MPEMTEADKKKFEKLQAAADAAVDLEEEKAAFRVDNDAYTRNRTNDAQKNNEK